MSKILAFKNYPFYHVLTKVKFKKGHMTSQEFWNLWINFPKFTPWLRATLTTSTLGSHFPIFWAIKSYSDRPLTNEFICRPSVSRNVSPVPENWSSLVSEPKCKIWMSWRQKFLSSSASSRQVPALSLFCNSAPSKSWNEQPTGVCQRERPIQWWISFTFVKDVIWLICHIQLSHI